MSRDDLLRLLVELRVAFDDADAVAEDVLAPRHKQELGPVLQKRNYRQAKRKVIAVHAEIVRRVGGAEPGNSGAVAH